MNEPVKPGGDVGSAQGGGPLGNIDEQRGHPGKGTGGASLKPEESGSRTQLDPGVGEGAHPAPADDRTAGGEANLYDRLAEKDATPTGQGSGL